MTRNAIITTRFSPRPGAAECESIATQLTRCRAFCVARGYEVIGEFEDRAVSGKALDGRDGLEEAIQLACKKKGVLIAYALDRVTRDQLDALTVLRRLQKHGADIALVETALDTATDFGELIYGILAAIGGYQRKQTGKRTSDALRRMHDDGYLTSRQPAFGFREIEPERTTRADGTPRVRRRIEKDDGEQQTIRDILAMREYATPTQIAKCLNEHRDCRGKPFTKSKVCKILRRAKDTAASA